MIRTKKYTSSNLRASIHADRETRQAFTLIELLTVIAIIAILAAILFPVFAQAKGAAKKAVCISNLKQIALGALMYSNDYDDQVMPLNQECDTPWPTGSLVCFNYWYGQGNIYYDGGNFGFSMNSSLGLVQPYMKNTAIQDCPVAPPDFYSAIYSNLQTPGQDTGLGYGMNNYIANGPASLTSSQLTNPASTIYLGDAAYADEAGTLGPGLPASNTVTTGLILWYPSAASFAGNLGSHGRHAGQADVTWCDGHAKSMAPSVVTPAVYTTDPSFVPFIQANNIGYMFRPGANFGTVDQDYYYLVDKGSL